MHRKLLKFAGLFVVAAGCSQSNDGSPSAKNTGPVASPQEVVTQFLEAVRTGNDQKASEMLSPLTRQKTAEYHLSLTPQASPTASFKVGDVEYRKDDKDGAFVQAVWTDGIDDNGKPRSDQVAWALRHEPEGWRIVGIVTKVYEDQPALILNFEDPEDMERKKQLLEEAEEAMLKVRQAASQPQAVRQQPENLPPR